METGEEQSLPISNENESIKTTETMTKEKDSTLSTVRRSNRIRKPPVRLDL